MANITYQLRAGVSGYTGGVIRVDDTRAYDVGAALAAGSGTITAPDTDAALLAALDAYAPLQRTGSTSSPPTPPPPPQTMRRLRLGRGSDPGETVLQAARDTDPYNRFELSVDGGIKTGDGTAAPSPLPAVSGSLPSGGPGILGRSATDGTPTWLQGSPVPPQLIRGDMPLITRSRSQLILDTIGGAPGAWRGNEVIPRQFLRDTDGSLYLVYTGRGSGNGGLRQMCRAKSDTGLPTGPFTDQGIITGLSGASGYDHCHLVREGANWYAFCGHGAASSTVELMKSTTGPFGSYTQVVASVAPLGSAGAWDVSRTMEPFGFRVPASIAAALATPLGFTPAWGCAYMGFDTSNAHEQIGFCFAATLENGGASYTKLGGSGTTLGQALTVGALGAPFLTEYDAEIISDPFLFFSGGLAWMYYCAGRQKSIGTTGRVCLALATSPDMQTWTKWGPQLEARAFIDVPLEAGPVWRGAFYHHTDGLIYWPHAASGDRNSAAGGQTIRAYLDVIDPVSFISGPRASRWQRVQAESADPRITNTGTWTIFTAGGATAQSFSGANASVSPGSAATASKTFDFRGTGVRVAGSLQSTLGKCDIYLDGTRVAQNVDLYKADATAHTPLILYETTGLPEGEHTLRVDVLGTKNAAASDTFVVLDYFEVLPGAGG